MPHNLPQVRLAFCLLRDPKRLIIDRLSLEACGWIKKNKKTNKNVAKFVIYAS